MHTAISILKAVLAASWQGSIVILMMLAVRPVLGPRVPARWRSLLWSFVLISLLVPAFLLPRNPASLANIQAVEQPIERAEVSMDKDYAAYLAAGDSRGKPVSAEAAGQGDAALHAPREWHSERMGWWQAGAMIWAAGAVLFAVWVAGGAIRLQRRIRREAGLVDGAVAGVWEECCGRFGVRHPVRLAAVGWVDSPALTGVTRATLLIPREAAFSPADWEHIFMHELAHLRRRDHWAQGLQLLALCVHWFNPLVWAGFRYLRADRELAADELALRRLEPHRATAYGGTLLKVLTGRAPGFLQPGMVGIMEDAAQLKERLRRIASFRPGSGAGSVAGFTLTVLFAAVVIGRQVNATDALAASLDSRKQDILAKAAARLAGISSLSFNAADTWVMTGGPDNGKILVKKVAFGQLGGQWRVKYEQIGGDQFQCTETYTTKVDGKDKVVTVQSRGAPNLKIYASWDGRTYRVFVPDQPALPPRVFPGPAAISFNQGLVNTCLYFLMPYRFVEMAAASTGNSHNDLSFAVDDIQSAANWATVLRNVKSITEGDLEGRHGIVVQLSGYYGNYLQDISVLLDPAEDYYPVAWETFDSDKTHGKHGLIYVITKMGVITNGKSRIRYPAEAVQTQFCGHDEPDAKSRIVITNPAVNSLDPGDRSFALTQNY